MDRGSKLGYTARMADASPTATSAPTRELPARFSLPLIGDTLSFLRDPTAFFTRRKNELGPVFRVRILGEDVACFCGPEAFTFFLDERYFTRADASPPHVQAILDPNAVPFLEGDRFARRKRLLMQVFSPQALDLYAPILERVIGRHTEQWAHRGSFQWVPELTSMAMTVAGALFMGKDPDRDDPEIVEAFQTAFGGFLTVPINLPFTAYGRALKARDYLRAKIEEAIDQHLKGDKNDAMTRAMTARTPEGETLSRDEVRIETFHFFGAYVPVIGGLAFLAMLLGQHPSVKDRARAEVKEKLGQGPVTPAGVRALTYLDAVCRESRRVQPVLPITFFGRVKETCSFNGVRIPQGFKAIGCIAPTLTDGETFTDSAKFDPDRWLSPTERQRAAWVPHGGGAHLLQHRCAGEQLADLMLKTFAVHLLRAYDWTLPPQDFGPTTGKLFATPRGGLQVEIKKL
jgi:cytochrome P450